MLSRRSKYGLKALLILAQEAGRGPVLVSELAEREAIPRKFLEAILLDLNRHGLVQSKKGKGGGYSLRRPPSDITFGDAVRAGDRVMLLEGSAVTLNFRNGCALNLNKPGVYTVPAVCTPGVAAQGVDWTGAAIIAGGVAVVAAGLASMDEVPGPPESR